MTPVAIQQGDSPIVLGLPHAGTWLPNDVHDSLSPNGQLLADTDWHVDRLYAGLLENVTTVRANFHRYVIDANRDPQGTSLYPGQNTTELVPTTDFDGKPIWDSPPSDSEIGERVKNYHEPYHAAMQTELNRICEVHGAVILFDCHSIRSQIPHLFEGRLPDLNIGTFNGKTCAKTIEEAVVKCCASAEPFTHILNGRFKGGWTTRHYGKPSTNVHAVQLEIAQNTYLESEAAPFHYSEKKADRLRTYLKRILESLVTVFETQIRETQ